MNELNNQAYNQRLKPWSLIKLLPDMQRSVVARFRSWSDAQGHLQVLQRLTPDTTYKIIFDPPNS